MWITLQCRLPDAPGRVRGELTDGILLLLQVNLLPKVPEFFVTPVRHTDGMKTLSSPCSHRPVHVAGLQIVACDSCRIVEWSGTSRPVDPAEGMAALFGDFHLVGRFPAIQAPGRQVLVYRAPGRKARAYLDAFPTHVWLRVDTDLWLSHDGENLQLAPTTPLRMENIRSPG